jgi:alpha-ketoglutarate-dependent taurine dioxygenase
MMARNADDNANQKSERRAGRGSYRDRPVGAAAEHDVDAIEAAWRERLVVVCHGQSLSDPQLIAFSWNFGELDPPRPNPHGEPFNKEHPELNVISNVVENGKPIGNLGDGEAMWHADMTYVDVPPKAGLLHALEVPPPEAGGNTYFANLFEAENLVNKLAVLPHDVVSKARQIYE